MDACAKGKDAARSYTRHYLLLRERKDLKQFIALFVLLVAAGVLVWTAFAPRGGPEVLVLDATAHAVPGQPGRVAIYMTLQNDGGPLRLTGAASSEAEAAAFDKAEGGLAVPGAATANLASDGAHLILTGLSGEAVEGRLIPFALEFGPQGAISGKALLETSETGMPGGDDAVVDLPAAEAPSLSLSVRPVPTGWQLDIQTERFVIREVPDGTAHVPGEGHGHLYLNGLKLGRLYVPQALIGPLPPGSHLFRVTLNSHDHRVYAADGAPVTATATVKAP